MVIAICYSGVYQSPVILYMKMPSKSVIVMSPEGIKTYSIQVLAQFEDGLDSTRPEEFDLRRSRSMSNMTAGPFSQIAKITDHLFLSSAKAITPGRIQSLGITNVINCTRNIPNVIAPDVECMQIHVHDVRDANLGVYFDMVADKVRNTEKCGGKTLIHCYAGVSRSATLCIAYLMKHCGMTLKEGYLHVLNQRPVIRPNKGFLRQLVDYEAQLYGHVSVIVRSNIEDSQTNRKFEEQKKPKKQVWFPKTLTTVYLIPSIKEAISVNG